MGDRTQIEWTDATWNPVTGCDKVSSGCDHCYAETIAHRFAGGKAYPNGFEVELRPDRLGQPLRWSRPRRVFVNSMSDLFHDEIPDEYIARVFSVMAIATQHTFQVLTKRPGRARSLLSRASFWHQIADAGRSDYIRDGQDWLAAGAMLSGDPLPNVWLGVSVEDQRWADIRVPALLGTPAAVRFLSCEPLLGAVDLASGDWLAPRVVGCWQPGYEPDSDDAAALAEVGRAAARHFADANGEPSPAFIDWVIVGGESGPGARPMHPDWARALRDQCAAAGVPFLFKQWGEYLPATGHNPLHTRVDGMPFSKVGKNAAGRELDGRTWDEFPRSVGAS